jgi:hypothetical protein
LLLTYRDSCKTYSETAAQPLLNTILEKLKEEYGAAEDGLDDLGDQFEIDFNQNEAQISLAQMVQVFYDQKKYISLSETI